MLAIVYLIHKSKFMYSRAPVILMPIIWINQKYYFAFFSGIFQNFSCKKLFFSADSLKKVEKKFLFYFKTLFFKKSKSLIETFFKVQKMSYLLKICEHRKISVKKEVKKKLSNEFCSEYFFKN